MPQTFITINGCNNSETLSSYVLNGLCHILFNRAFFGIYQELRCKGYYSSISNIQNSTPYYVIRNSAIEQRARKRCQMYFFLSQRKSNHLLKGIAYCLLMVDCELRFPSTLIHSVVNLEFAFLHFKRTDLIVIYSLRLFFKSQLCSSRSPHQSLNSNYVENKSVFHLLSHNIVIYLVLF